jgi:hypothetical protein
MAKSHSLLYPAIEEHSPDSRNIPSNASADGKVHLNLIKIGFTGIMMNEEAPAANSSEFSRCGCRLAHLRDLNFDWPRRLRPQVRPTSNSGRIAACREQPECAERL